MADHGKLTEIMDLALYVFDLNTQIDRVYVGSKLADR